MSDQYCLFLHSASPGHALATAEPARFVRTASRREVANGVGEMKHCMRLNYPCSGYEVS